MLQGYYKVVWFDKQGYESNEVFAVATESDELQLVPNPARAKVGIILRGMVSHDVTVGIYDLTGTQVLTYRLPKASEPEMDVSLLTPGLYYIRAEMNHKVYHKKLLKQ